MELLRIITHFLLLHHTVSNWDKQKHQQNSIPPFLRNKGNVGFGFLILIISMVPLKEPHVLTATGLTDPQEKIYTSKSVKLSVALPERKCKIVPMLN
jgi:hypothetical protein